MARPHLISKFMAAVAAVLVLADIAHAQAGNADDGAASILILLLIAAVLYVVPTIVAFSRTHPNRWLILVINVVFGGTGLGWLGSLVWACSAVHRSPTGNHGGESGLNLFVNDVQKVQFEGVALVTASEPDDPAEHLRRLKRLFDEGSIDADEYKRLREPALKKLMSGL